MQTFLSILLGLAMFATLGVMLAGMVGLARGDDNGARSNKLMRWRVGLQGLSLLLFVLLALSMGRG
ncbi:twin transmembrane helix small protein [Pseudoroseomonas cervicalis]|uniref:twin transmembrane helix small protein n=1 Tax=Teichococcus cervicalis TaxID=204525 RepID=UPI0022F1A750|nr:twin transmembrane helix small protein [Pseudoroseomonas cervicalis]WBV42666.1 twin transmembrane helix small protein [Pseudoroseomonas cervicalis]